MQATNKSLMGPFYYRCNPISHHRVGSKYKVYSKYVFACSYVDSIEGVTHVPRSSEYHVHNEKYYRVLQDMGLRKVHAWDC
jgi:glutamyl-tRNA synthetase